MCAAAGRKEVRHETLYPNCPRQLWPENGGGGRGANAHYPLMRVAEIAALPISELSAENAHLYLWTTNNYLHDALHVMEAWGFRYI